MFALTSLSEMTVVQNVALGQNRAVFPATAERPRIHIIGRAVLRAESERMWVFGQEESHSQSLRLGSFLSYLLFILEQGRERPKDRNVSKLESNLLCSESAGNEAD
jgi:hypothetical protein